MITDDLTEHDILKTLNMNSPAAAQSDSPPAIKLQKQVRDVSERVFFDIQSLLRLANDQAEESLAAYQVLANAEISHMEDTIDRQQTELSALQDHLHWMQQEQKNLQATHEADIALIKDSEARLQEAIQREEALKAASEEEKMVNAKIVERITDDFEDQLANANTAFYEEKAKLQQMLEHKEAQYQQHLESVKKILDNKEKQHQQQIATVKQAYQEEINGLQTSSEDRIRKLESLLALERENAKNKQQAWLAKCKSMEETYAINVQRERELAQNHILRGQQQQRQAWEADLQAALAAKQKAHEKETSVLAQKKLTVEMNMKQLHKELIECKRIISALRQKQSRYSEAL